MTVAGVKIDGLNEFRAALRRAEQASPRELTKALKAAGKPVAEKASGYAPRLSGDLAGGYKVSVRGTTANVVNREPYSAGAEWGRFGKWAGFTKYPSGPESDAGRFAWRAVKEDEDRLAEDILRGLRDVVTANGWFRGSLGG